MAADIWVLTESNAELSPGSEYAGVWSAEPDRDGARGEVWTAIWSRYPLQPLGSTRDSARAVCALVEPPGRRSVVVYGTVLPWLGSRWRQYPGADGVAFGRALQAQLDDWKGLRASHPECEFVLAGDLNQDLAPRHHYGSKRNRAALKVALKAAGLRCLTAGADDPVWTTTKGRWATIDHVCASNGLAERAVGPAYSWPPGNEPDRNLSDHFGVVVEFS